MHANPLSDLRGDLKSTATADLKEHPFDCHLREAQRLANEYNSTKYVKVYSSNVELRTDMWLTDPFSQLSVIGHFGRCLKRDGIQSNDLPNHPLIRELHGRIDDYVEKTGANSIVHDDFTSLILVSNQLARVADLERLEKDAEQIRRPISKDRKSPEYERFSEKPTSGYRDFHAHCATTGRVREEFDQLLSILTLHDDTKKELRAQFQEKYGGGREDLYFK